MFLAFVIGAMASGFVVAGLTALVVWIATVTSGSSEPWAAAPWLVSTVAVLVAIGTYSAENIAHRRTMARMRSTGEPWAYRD